MGDEAGLGTLLFLVEPKGRMLFDCELRANNGCLLLLLAQSHSRQIGTVRVRPSGRV